VARRGSRYRGRDFPPSLASPPEAAPRSFYPHDDLENAVSRAQGLYNPVERTLFEAVQPRPRALATAPLYPYKPAFRPFAAGRYGRPPNLAWHEVINRKVGFCVARKARRESLFALRKIGFAGSSPGRRSKFTGKYYRRNGNSIYACR